MKLDNKDLGLLILRLALGSLMLFHGYAKIVNGVSGMADKFSDSGIPGFIAYGAYVGEVLAPLMILAGIRTRIAAMLYCFTMIFALFFAHSGDLGSLGKGGGWAVELNMLYILGSLALIFTGAGKYALSTRSKWD
jgi:putative oxidoreductase